MTISERTIVCGVEGGWQDPLLLDVARGMARALRATCVLVHVLGAQPLARPGRARTVALPEAYAPQAPESAEWGEDAEASAAERLRRLATEAGMPAAPVRVVRFGDPGRRLADVAEALRADLLVVGTRGERAGRDALLGSVSSRLAADAPCPVLIVPPRSKGPRAEPWRGRTLVCGVDASDPAWHAARVTRALAALLDGSVLVLTVATCAVDGVHAGEVARRLVDDDAVVRRRGGCEVRHVVRLGDPAEELARAAAAATAPLVAVGSRGVGPWRAALIGSVTRRVLRLARRPILVVPPSAAVPRAGSVP